MKQRKARRTSRDPGKNSMKGKINRQKDNRVEVLRFNYKGEGIIGEKVFQN